MNEMGAAMTECDFCGESVIVAMTPGRRLVPVTAKKSPMGNLKLSWPRHEPLPIAEVVLAGEGEYCAHTVDCVAVRARLAKRWELARGKERR